MIGFASLVITLDVHGLRYIASFANGLLLKDWDQRDESLWST
jgi:hypothetical protein